MKRKTTTPPKTSAPKAGAVPAAPVKTDLRSLPGGLFTSISVAFLAVAIHYAAIRVVVTYMPFDRATLLATIVLPAIITLWILPPARRHGLHRWLVLWFVYATTAFPVIVLVVGETWILHRFFAVDFPGQSKFAKSARVEAMTVKNEAAKVAADRRAQKAQDKKDRVAAVRSSDS